MHSQEPLLPHITHMVKCIREAMISGVFLVVMYEDLKVSCHCYKGEFTPSFQSFPVTKALPPEGASFLGLPVSS